MGELAVRKRTRRLLIDLAWKRQKVGSGSEQAFLRQRTTQMQFPDLTAYLAPVLWAAVGAAATRLYMPERATNDMAILIRAEDAARMREQLAQAGAIYQAELSIGGSSWALPDGFPLDVIECREGWAMQALTEAQTNRDASGMRVLPLPYLVLTKFQASRVQDLADITRMLGQASEEQRSAVRIAFARWLPDETEDLESLIALGQLEME
jgi:hypothetical protein